MTAMSILYGYVLSIDFRRKEYPTMHTSISGSFSRSSSFFGGSKKSKRQSQSFSVHRSMNETGYLMRLASARTPSQVSAVIAAAQADAKSVKQSSSSSSEIQKAKKIAKSIEKQGTLKSAKLRREKQLEKEARTELAAKNLKRAKNTAAKLAKKRRVRKAQEQAAIANSIPVCDHRRRHVDEYVDDSTPLSQYSFDNLKTREEAAAQAAAINAAINAGETPSSGDAAAATTGSAVSSADAAAAVSGISGVSGSAIDCSI
jgi:hypothetical protein